MRSSKPEAHRLYDGAEAAANHDGKGDGGAQRGRPGSCLCRTAARREYQAATGERLGAARLRGFGEPIDDARLVRKKTSRAEIEEIRRMLDEHERKTK